VTQKRKRKQQATGIPRPYHNPHDKRDLHPAIFGLGQLWQAVPAIAGQPRPSRSQRALAERWRMGACRFRERFLRTSRVILCKVGEVIRNSIDNHGNAALALELSHLAHGQSARAVRVRVCVCVCVCVCTWRGRNEPVPNSCATDSSVRRTIVTCATTVCISPQRFHTTPECSCMCAFWSEG
jgi:hypothetical protein